MADYHKTGLPSMVSVEEIMTFFRMRFQPGMQPGEEAHPFWEFVYVERGSVLIDLGGTEHRVTAGSLLFYPPETPHRAAAPMGEETELAVVSFSSASPALSRFRGKVLRPGETLLPALGEMLEAGCGMFRWCGEKDEQRGMYLREDAGFLPLCRVKQQLEYFLTALAFSEAEGDGKGDWRESYDRGRLESVTDYLESRLHLELSAEEIARDCLISTSVLKRLFRQYMGLGVMTYFTQRKIERAKELLLRGDLTVTEVSRQLGFASPFYFSRLFKQKTGTSPSEYREGK